MCGIAGVLPYASKMDRELRYLAIKYLLTKLVIETERRGRDATGVFQTYADGFWTALKKGDKASNFLFNKRNSKDPVVYSDMLEHWEKHAPDLKSVIAHCRSKTVGSEYDNDNNHPIIMQVDKRNAILGVHNGTLSNHEEIFNKLKHIKRFGQVDSEAIFMLLYHYSKSGSEPMDIEVVKKTVKALDGAYAVVATNTSFPNKVITFRSGRPLEFAMISPLNIVLIASETSILDDAIQSYKMARLSMLSRLPELTVEKRTLREKDACIFNLEAEWPKELRYNSIDAISKTTDLSPVIKTWKSTAYSGSSHHGTYGVQRPAYSAEHGSGHAITETSTSKATHNESSGEAKKTTTIVPITTQPERDKESIEVSMRVLSKEDKVEESNSAFGAMMDLGLMSQWKDQYSLATELGISESDVEKVSRAELASILFRMGFARGYASHMNIEGSSKDKESLERVLKIAEKKKKSAQQVIWDLRCICAILQILAKRGEEPSYANIKKILEVEVRPLHGGERVSRMAELSRFLDDSNKDGEIARLRDMLSSLEEEEEANGNVESTRAEELN